MTKQNTALNGGQGYSRFVGNNGFPTGHLLAWSEAYLQRGYLVLYRNTGDAAYLDTCRAHIAAVRANRDDRRGQRDYLGALNPTWGTDKYEVPLVRWRFYTMNDALILVPMLESVLAAGADPDGLVAEAEQVMAFHDPEWRGPWYGYPAQYGGNRVNYPLALDMQATIGKVEVLLADLTGKPAYRQRAADILAWVLSQRRVVNGYTVWPDVRWDDVLLPPHGDPNSTIEWSDTVEFVLMCQQRGYGVPAELLRQLADTAARLMQTGRLALRCDGVGFGNDPIAGAYLLLAPYDSRIAPRVRKVLDGLNLRTTLPLLDEAWWGPAMLSVARISPKAISRGSDRRARPK